MLLAACGSTSDIQSSNTPGAKVDLSRYSSVIIRDFNDMASQEEEGKDRDKLQSKMTQVTRDFADMIAEEVRKQGAFTSVKRDGSIDDSTLVVSGKITNYTEGNAAARVLVGFGAGSSRFEGMVDFTDGKTGASVGSVVIDKSSWALGGAFAANQTVDRHMKGAAIKVANELYTAKTGLVPARAQ